MIISGYLDGYEPPILRSPLIDGSEMMSSDLFWPAFLYTVGGSASAPKAFDTDPADLSEFIDTLLSPHGWPVFSRALRGRVGELGIDHASFAPAAPVCRVPTAPVGLVPPAGLRPALRQPRGDDRRLPATADS